MNLLDLVIFAPAIGFLLVLLLPKDNVDTIKRATFVISILVFLASLLLIPGVLGNPSQMTYVSDTQWIAYPNIRYHIGIDGVSLWLIILTTFLTPIAMLISWRHIDQAAETVLCVPAAAGVRPHRRVRRARSVPVLRVLGSVAGSDVLPDRHLGT